MVWGGRGRGHSLLEVESESGRKNGWRRREKEKRGEDAYLDYGGVNDIHHYHRLKEGVGELGVRTEKSSSFVWRSRHKSLGEFTKTPSALSSSRPSESHHGVS